MLMIWCVVSLQIVHLLHAIAVVVFTARIRMVAAGRNRGCTKQTRVVQGLLLLVLLRHVLDGFGKLKPVYYTIQRFSCQVIVFVDNIY